jgi:hypothetical protein
VAKSAGGDIHTTGDTASKKESYQAAVAWAIHGPWYQKRINERVHDQLGRG